MGSCVSVHKDSMSALKLRLEFGSKNHKLVTPSPVKDKPMVAADHVVKSHTSLPPPVTAFRDVGSKEETFFDSHPWLESDCEDDFFSVNGDFTPSRGNTPVHHSFPMGTPHTNRRLFAERTSNMTPDRSPTEKRKKLAELFKDTVASDQDVSGVNSAGSGERSPNGHFKLPREKSVERAQSCLPRFRSFSGKKKRTSPAHSVGDK